MRPDKISENLKYKQTELSLDNFFSAFSKLEQRLGSFWPCFWHADWSCRKSFPKCQQENGYDKQKLVPEVSRETNQQDKHKSEWARCYWRSQIFNLGDTGTLVRGYRNLKSSLSVCMSVCVFTCTMCLHCLQSPEESFGSQQTAVSDSCSCYV